MKGLTMATTKSFKLSQLPEISQSTISNDDLLLVSDYNGGKCESKKMKIGEYSSFIAKKITPQIQQIVAQALEAALEEQIPQIAQQVLEDKLPAALSAALEGDAFDNVVKDSLDRISDGKKDELILVNGGNADSGGIVNEP